MTTSLSHYTTGDLSRIISYHDGRIYCLSRDIHLELDLGTIDWSMDLSSVVLLISGRTNSSPSLNDCNRFEFDNIISKRL